MFKLRFSYRTECVFEVHMINVFKNKIILFCNFSLIIIIIVIINVDLLKI